MYKTRLTRWGFFKNNREEDAKAILQLKKERDAEGKYTEVQVNGRTVQIRQVAKYLRRKKIATSSALDKPHKTLAEYITVRTPSRSPEPMTPATYRVPEYIFSSIRSWTWGSYEAGKWAPDELGCATIVDHASEPATASFIHSVALIAELIQTQKFNEAGPIMRSVAAQVENLLQSQPFDLIACFMEVVIRLRSLAPEVATSIIRQSAAMAKVYLASPFHPLRAFLDQLAKAEIADMMPLAVTAYTCQLETWRHIKEHGASNEAIATWMTELSLYGGFTALPYHLVPHLDDLTARLAEAMKGSEWSENFFRNLTESNHGKMFALDPEGYQVEFIMQPPGTPTKATGVRSPFAHFSLRDLNHDHRHFMKEDRSVRDTLESRHLLDSDIGSFLVRMATGTAEWLEAWGEYERAAEVTMFLTRLLAAKGPNPAAADESVVEAWSQ